MIKRVLVFLFLVSFVFGLSYGVGAQLRYTPGKPATPPPNVAPSPVPTPTTLAPPVSGFKIMPVPQQPPASPAESAKPVTLRIDPPTKTLTVGKDEGFEFAALVNEVKVDPSKCMWTILSGQGFIRNGKYMVPNYVILPAGKKEVNVTIRASYPAPTAGSLSLMPVSATATIILSSSTPPGTIIMPVKPVEPPKTAEPPSSIVMPVMPVKPAEPPKAAEQYVLTVSPPFATLMLVEGKTIEQQFTAYEKGRNVTNACKWELERGSLGTIGPSGNLPIGKYRAPYNLASPHTATIKVTYPAYVTYDPNKPAQKPVEKRVSIYLRPQSSQSSQSKPWKTM